MKIKRVIALMCATLMVMSTAACAQKTPASDSTNSDTTEVTAGTAGGVTDGAKDGATGTCQDTGCVWDPYTPCKETVTITKGIERKTGDKFAEGDDYVNNYFTRYIEEQANVKIESAWEADTNNYEQKTALCIATGEMPDVMIVDRTMFRQLVDSDMIWDLTEVYEKCALPLVKECHASYGDRLMREVTVDGKIMGIPGTQIAGQHGLLWIRQDWLDAVGLQVPRTLDEVEAVAKAFIEQDPGHNGAGKTVGLTATEDVVGEYNVGFGLYPLFNYFDAYPKSWIEVDGKAAYGSIQPEMKAILQKLNEWYENGILDKEFAVRKQTDREALVSSGQLGMLFTPWWGWNGIPEAVQSNPDAKWTVVAAPLDAEGNYKVCANDPVNKIMVISKNVEHPEAVMKAFNAAWECGTGNGNGKEAFEEMQKLESEGSKAGVNPLHIQLDYENGVERAMNELKKGLDAKDPSVMTSIFRLDWSYGCMLRELENPGADVYDWHEYFVRTTGSAAASYDKTVMKDVVFYGTTDTMASRWANLEKLETETMIKIITGEKPVDYFDEFVETWNKMGGEQITEEVQAIVDGN